MPQLPPLTPEARASALAKAKIAVKARSDLKASLKRGSVTLADALAEADADATIGKMKVSQLLKSMPGVGEIRAKQIMERLRIADNRRISGLGSNQRAELEREFAPVAA
jgi:transposase